MVLKMIGSVVMMFVWSPVLGAISLALVLPLYAASKRVAVKSKEIAAEQRAASRSSRGRCRRPSVLYSHYQGMGKRAF